MKSRTYDITPWRQVKGMQNHGKLQRMFMKVNILRVLFFIKLP